MKRLELIHLENQTVGIDRTAEIKEGDKIYNPPTQAIDTCIKTFEDGTIIVQFTEGGMRAVLDSKHFNKIIFSRPLLPGTILLPDWEEDNDIRYNIEQIKEWTEKGLEYSLSHKDGDTNSYVEGCIIGFQSAQKKFSLEDILEMFDGYMNEEKALFEKMSFKEYIFSLKKKPIAIEYDGIKDGQILNFKYIY